LKKRVDIRLLLKIALELFEDNYSIEKSFNQILEWQEKLSITTIQEIFQKLRNFVTLNMMKEWQECQIGIVPAQDGIPRVEVDETHLLHSDGQPVWLFGMYDRGTQDVRLIVVGNDRSSNTLLPLIRSHVFTCTVLIHLTGSRITEQEYTLTVGERTLLILLLKKWAMPTAELCTVTQEVFFTPTT